MLTTLVKKIFGTNNDRIIRKKYDDIKKINDLEKEFILMSDEELQYQTTKFKQALQEGKTENDILHEAFATVREVSKRVLKMRHFDVQLMGGMVMHDGMIAEMGTGEGKTLASTLPAYLNALTGKGVHIVTVNDYLVERDANWMGKIFEFLGLQVGCIKNDLQDKERFKAYSADITYGTNNEFGFDYLRDNMKFSPSDKVQRPFNFAIIDEIDSILIDEARTPLVISGPTESNSELYSKINKLIPCLKSDDYEKDEKSRTVTLTEKGTIQIENLLTEHHLIKPNTNLYDVENINLIHHVNQALKAHKLFTKEVDYLVKEGNVMIIDEFTGRALEGRRYSEGLHQAIEAKENVIVRNESQTLASITFQNYFRLYPKIAGMTGTAMTEAEEFYDIYKLNVIEIPTNKRRIRIDAEDEIYRTAKEKYSAIIDEIEEAHKQGQPVLVGTTNIDKSEYLSKLLKKRRIAHSVLNAKYHEQEAKIIAEAGRYKTVTIATNMAGRGTDIKLGGNIEQACDQKQKLEIQKVIDAGGLYVIGTERHESRRIDNQLRGRSGRQGDPGKSKFYLSLEDDLMRIFASEKISNILQKIGLKEGEPIFHPMITKALERAQQKVEARNFEIRKNLLKFDNVSNDQRKIVYEQRSEIMYSEDLIATIEDMAYQINEELIFKFIPENSYPEQWDTHSLDIELHRIYGCKIAAQETAKSSEISPKILLEKINEIINQLIEKQIKNYGHEIFNLATKQFLLVTLDSLWKEHLHSLDQLRQGINLRAYGQKDPLNEYKKEAFFLFEQMLIDVREQAVQKIVQMKLKLLETENGPILVNDPYSQQASTSDLDQQKFSSANNQEQFNWGKIRRNDLCPCNSGKKYKHCHGKL